MKILFYRGILTALLVSAFAWSVWAQDKMNLPSPSGYVNDFAGMMEPVDQQAINALLTALESKTTTQVAVVIVVTTQPDTIEQYAVKLFQKWGIGQKGKDNGVLFLIAVRDHTLRIEVGYGLEGVLTDAISSQVISQIVVPEFKHERMSYGILQGTRAIVSLIAKEYGVTVTGQEAAIYNSLHSDTSGLWIIVFVFILIFMFYAFSFSRRGVGWYGYYGGGGGFSGGSGGFGGFGGGMSGGGGASGSW
ncbi:MAG: TPM domain-containing protein [Candidatus Omnitrophica bacterium]|nr:TPM domain-containing protein [Candidatus Omnitrophota bacterium]